jgi:serine phosphatase RsbU (regulator of sigma subunit)
VAAIFGWLYSLPLAAAGLVWLALASRPPFPIQHWPVLLLTALILIIVTQLDFFIVIEVGEGHLAGASGKLDDLVLWAGVLLVGPVVLWVWVAWLLISFLRRFHHTPNPALGWSRLRDFTLSLSGSFSYMVAISLYHAWHGTIPYLGLSSPATWPAFGAVAVYFLLSRLMWAPYVLFFYRTGTGDGAQDRKNFLRFLLIGVLLPGITYPFGILAASLYAQNGAIAYLFFMAGILLVGLMAHQLSRSAESGRRQSRQLEQLERLGREFINAPPDGSTLADLLATYVPPMFTLAGTIEIRIYPRQTLLRHPPETETAPEDLWNWLREQREVNLFFRPARLPWNNERLQAEEGLFAIPILDVDTRQPLGGIVFNLERSDLAHTGRQTDLIPALKTLADSIASALHRADVYAQTLAYQQAMQDISTAGKIQERFLPEELPVLPGWQLSAALKPARQASGDFYDVIPLPNGMFGLVMADVADKGMGAALYMALSRTLLRTYALEWGNRTSLAFGATNRRILDDTYADQFVTVFYGVVDPSSGELAYSNAGHNPPYLFAAGGRDVLHEFIRTGPPLGIATGVSWTQAEARIAPGDALVLYTDGVVEAQNAQGEFYGNERLQAVVKSSPRCSAAELQSALLADVEAFVGEAPQYDDITLMVLVREPGEPGATS